MQSSLHFKPQLFFQLFCYQRNFYRLVAKYKFEACYRYDKDFRLLVASQSSLSPEQRTAKWECRHRELRNMHLQQDMLLPSCFHCRKTGHFAPNCPLKSTGDDEAFRNVASNQPINSQSPIQAGQTMETAEFGTSRLPMSSRSTTTCNRFNNHMQPFQQRKFLCQTTMPIPTYVQQMQPRPFWGSMQQYIQFILSTSSMVIPYQPALYVI